MEATAESFQKWAMELGEQTSDSKDHEYSVWVDFASLCATRYVNDPRQLEREREETGSRELGARKPFVQ